MAAFEARCPVEQRDWHLVRERGQVVGCLLLRGLSATDPVELMYWGLIPEARGRRMGDRLLQLGQQLAGQRGKLLVACIDQANQPAWKAFQRAGFWACGRQQLYIRPLDRSAMAARRDPASNGYVLAAGRRQRARAERMVFHFRH